MIFLPATVTLAWDGGLCCAQPSVAAAVIESTQPRAIFVMEQFYPLTRAAPVGRLYDVALACISVPDRAKSNSSSQELETARPSAFGAVKRQRRAACTAARSK